MNPIKKIFQREATSVNGQTSGGTNWLAEIVSAGSDKSSMNVAAVWRCVNLISDSIAIMPLRYKWYDETKGIYVPYTKGDRDRLFYLLNVRPNDRMNGYVFKKNLVMHILLKGNAYVVPVDEYGIACGFQNYKMHHLVLLTGNTTYCVQTNRYTICDPDQGIRSQTVAASDIAHFKNPGTDGGFLGESTVNHAARSLNMLATADNLALKTVSTGGRIKAILTGLGGTSPIGHNQKQMSNAALDVEDNLAQHDIVTLPDKNLELKPLSMSASEMDFVNNRKFGVEDVCRWFGVPPYKLGMVNSNYKSVDAAQVDFYTEALLPICSQIENELLCKYTSPTSWEMCRFDFDEKPLFQLDMDTRSKIDKADLENGVKSINDLRRDRDIEPVEGGDTLFMSANLKSLNTLISEGNNANTQS